MARIVGIDLPKNKRVEIGLTYIYGIGRPTSLALLEEAEVDKDKRVKDLTEEEVGRITNLITKTYKVEGDLRREVTQNIRRLKDIKSYRGLRHRNNLPCRGQRTKTNARTRRGKRGANKK
jgi:small subunit ribosomal protein S13